MKSKIINWAFISLLAFLTACGGSDATDSNTGTNTGDSDSQDGSNVDTVTDVDNSNLALSGTFEEGDSTDQSNQDQSILGVAEGEALSASGSTTVKVYVVNTADNNTKFLGARDVFFTSTCAQVGLAEFIPPSLKASGEATSTYYDKGCGKQSGTEDNIVVTLGTQDQDGNIVEIATTSAKLYVEAAQVGAIQYASAEPTTIALNGFGTEATPSLSKLTFQVVDKSGNPMPDRDVMFELDHEYGSASLSLNQAVTDQEGKVVVMLNAGNVSGTVRVKALVEVFDENGVSQGLISTMSPPLTMATSLADQNSFGLAIDVANPNAWEKLGTQTTVTAYLADHYQNPVLDGTTVYFRATGGFIQPSCLTSGGSCSVTWTSTNPKPDDGYVTILAFTRGQGDYQDSNANGVFDLEESFTSFGEFFIDANYNGSYNLTEEYQPDVDVDGDGNPEFFWDTTAYQVNVYDSVNGNYEVAASNFFEEFIDSNNNGEFDEQPSGYYQGVNCSAEALADTVEVDGVIEGHCQEQIQVFRTLRLQMSQGNSAYIEGPFTVDDTGSLDYENVVSCVDVSRGAVPLAWRLSDSRERRNDLPAGTGIDFSTEESKMLSQSGTGEVAVHFPSDTLSVWKGKRTPPYDKNEYLNDRGMLVTGWVTSSDSPQKPVGQVSVEVDQVTGAKLSSGAALVDLVGFTPAFLEGRFVKSEFDLYDNVGTTSITRSVELRVSNYCNDAFPNGYSLIVGANIGSFSNVIAVSGGALDVANTDTDTIELVGDGSGSVNITFDLSDSGSDSDDGFGLEVYMATPTGVPYRIGSVGIIENRDP